MAGEEIAIATGAIVGSIAAAVAVPLVIQYVKSVSDRLAESNILHKQLVNNTSSNMSHTATNVTEEISKTAKQ